MSHAVAGINRFWFTTDPESGGRQGRSNSMLAMSRIVRGDAFFENERCLGDSPERRAEACPCGVCEYLRKYTPTRFAGGSHQRGQSAWRDAAITLHNVHLQHECVRRLERLARENAGALLARALMPMGIEVGRAMSHGRHRAAKCLHIFNTQEQSDVMVNEQLKVAAVT